MNRWVKFLVIAMLVAFAASTAVQSAQMTAMDMTMSMPIDDTGCSDCPTGDDVACASGCVVPNVGFIDSVNVRFVPGLNQVLLPANADFFTAWQTPPDPYPPRHMS